jgi:hypothetical protein
MSDSNGNEQSTDRFGGKDWVPEDIEQSLKLDREFSTVTNPATGEQIEPTDVVLMRNIFKTNGPAAALRIAHIAVHGQNENTALRAAMYVVERNMGRLQDAIQVVDDPMTKMFMDMQADEDQGSATSEAEDVKTQQGGAQ